MGARSLCAIALLHFISSVGCVGSVAENENGPCESGFERVDGACVDIDECATDNGNCGANVECSNNAGSFSCGGCLAGFDDDGSGACVDIDECATDNGGCGDATYWTCVNQSGADPLCEDIDECATANGGCGIATYWGCMNQPGADPLCLDVDECATNNGGCGDATYWSCANLAGADALCADIDECATNNGSCGDVLYWTCTNQPGADPLCDDIDECATDNGGCGNVAYWTCTNQAGTDPLCEDVDECATSNGGCGDAALWSCINQAGADPICDDFDECATNNGDCGDPAAWLCTNQVGAPPVCDDIDECALVPTPCDPVPCHNLTGSYFCGNCPPDYEDVNGDGTSCVPYLLNLETPDGTLTPAFDQLVTSYGTDLSLVLTTTTVIPTAPPGASILVNGAPVASGQVSQSLGLTYGTRSYDVVVGTAPDTRTYTVDFVREITTTTYVKSETPIVRGAFGRSVAIDGDTLAVGESGSGAARVSVYRRGVTGWALEQTFAGDNTGSSDDFGYSVALQGDTLVVGALGEESRWGDPADNGGTAVGAAYVFARTGTSWSQTQYLKGPTANMARFGVAAAIHDEWLVVGSLDDEVYMYRNVAGTWTEDGRPSGPGFSAFGRSVALTAGVLAVGASNDDEAYVFERNAADTRWDEIDVLSQGTSSNWFGSSVALDGDVLVVGAAGDDTNGNGSGAAYIFQRGATQWSYVGIRTGSDADSGAHFGETAAISGTLMVIGASGEWTTGTGINPPSDSCSGCANTGAVYLFQRPSTISSSWTQVARITADHSDPVDFFGEAVAVDGSTLAVGAPDEDSAATGINGDYSVGVVSESGAVYIYE